MLLIEQGKRFVAYFPYLIINLRFVFVVIANALASLIKKSTRKILDAFDCTSCRHSFTLSSIWMHKHTLKFDWVESEVINCTHKHIRIQLPWSRLFDKRLVEMQIQFKMFAQSLKYDFSFKPYKSSWFSISEVIFFIVSFQINSISFNAFTFEWTSAINNEWRTACNWTGMNSVDDTTF